MILCYDLILSPLQPQRKFSPLGFLEEPSLAEKKVARAGLPLCSCFVCMPVCLMKLLACLRGSE